MQCQAENKYIHNTTTRSNTSLKWDFSRAVVVQILFLNHLCLVWVDFVDLMEAKGYQGRLLMGKLAPWSVGREREASAFDFESCWYNFHVLFNVQRVRSKNKLGYELTTSYIQY
jgi:hypothetical protein